MQPKSMPLTEQVANQLATEIAAGVYSVGDKLPTGKALSQLYGVSAAVIREATERLRTQGLVESRQGAGCTVISRTANGGFQVPGRASLSRDDLANVYELRMELEGGAAALAATRRNETDLAEMKRCLLRLQEFLHQPEQAAEADIAFHAAIAAATHNTYYQQLLQYLNLQVRTAVRMARDNTLQLQFDRVIDVYQEHVELYDAIAAGDMRRARRAAVMHLRLAASRLQLTISQVEDDSDVASLTSPPSASIS